MNIYRKMRRRREWLVPACLLILVILLRLPSLEHPFDHDSAAKAYHARLILRGEPLYGTHHPSHHLPGVYYVYALAFWLGGDSMWAVKFLLLWWIFATAYLVYRLGRLAADGATGFLAAVIFAILTAHVWLWGNSSQIEQFANLPRVAAVLLLLALTSKGWPAPGEPGPGWQFIFVGLLAAAAFLFKAVYLSPLALTAFVLALEAWRNRARPGIGPITIRRGLWAGLGFAAGLLLVAAYFSREGLLARFLLVFSRGQDYAGNSPESPLYILLYPLVGLGYNNLLLLIYSLAGFILICINRTHRNSPLFYVAAWYGLAFLEASGLVRAFRFYYYLLLVPPLAVLSAWFLIHLYRTIRAAAARPMVAPLTLAGFLAAALLISAVQNFNFYGHYVRYRLGYETFRDFLAEGSPFGPQLIIVQDVADYIRGHTTPADRVVYWGDNVQLYYLADRRPPVDVIWPYQMIVTGAYRRIATPQTRYFIVDPASATVALIQPEISKHYTLETVIYDQKIYRRID